MRSLLFLLLAGFSAVLILPPPDATGVQEPGVRLRGLASVDLTPDGRFVVAAGRKDRSVAIVDLAQDPPAVRNLTAADGVGRRPIQVAATAAGTVVVHEHDTFLALLDPAAGVITRTVSVPLYCQDVVWDPVRQRWYVSNKAFDEVLVFEADWAAADPPAIAAGRQPGPMALGPDGRLYVGNRASFDLSVLDPDLGQEVGRVWIGSRPEDVEATDTEILVTNHGGSGLSLHNGVPLIQDDQTDIENVVTSVDPSTLQSTRLWVDRGADYSGLDVLNGGSLIAWTGAGDSSIHIHESGMATDETVSLRMLQAGHLPGAWAPSGLEIYANTRDLVIVGPERILAASFLRGTLIDVRRFPDGWGVVGEIVLNEVGVPITAFQDPPAVNFTTRQNGERYFHTLAAWRRGQEDFTCATCHPDGHSDLRMIYDSAPDPFDPDSDQGPERHPSARFSGVTLPLAWEGDVPSLLDFNLEALDIHDVPPANGVVHTDVAQFMVFYERTLVPGPNPFPDASGGRGEALFFGSAGCSACHAGPWFTDNGFYDVGTGRTLNTPTLLGLWERPTYLHDGRAATLRDVLDPAIYDPGAPAHGNLAGLSEQDKDDLVDYLLGLRRPPEKRNAQQR